MLGAAGCGLPSTQDVETVQTLSELGASFNDLRLVQQEQQDQLDSLRVVIVKQDSTIRSLANLAGIQPPQP